METAKGKAKALQGMIGGTVVKGKVVPKGTGTNANKRARSETQRSAARWGAVWCIRGVSHQPSQSAYVCSYSILTAGPRPPRGWLRKALLRRGGGL